MIEASMSIVQDSVGAFLDPNIEIARMCAAAKANPILNAMDCDLATRPQVSMPVTHNFSVPGFYIRQIFMPAGTELTSKIHKTRHPFVITQGKCGVLTADGNIVLLSKGHVGITEPGTRRALKIYEDTIWTTFHPTEETDLVKLEAELIEPHDIPALAIDGQSALAEGGL